ncbi:hypothetical protein FXO37_12602 [Capsicum annuum]|nr:hypothetical protein FXO37_12602 [Capsicum annuum]
MAHPGQGVPAALIDVMSGERNRWTTEEGIALNISQKLLNIMNGRHLNLELAERDAENIFHLDPNCSAAYVLLSNISAFSGRWSDVARVKRKYEKKRKRKTTRMTLDSCTRRRKNNIVLVIVFSFEFSHERYAEIWEEGKLSPSYIGPFDILRTIGDVAYKLDVPPALSAVYPAFLVSMPHRYILNESHVIFWNSVQLDEMLCFIEEPIFVLAKDVRRLLSRVILVVKV